MTDSGDYTRLNRGMAILGDEVFLGTLNAHVIALDAKTGNVVWERDRGRLWHPTQFHCRAARGERRDRDRRLPQRIWHAGSRRYGKEFVAIATGSGLYGFGFP